MLRRLTILLLFFGAAVPAAAAAPPVLPALGPAQSARFESLAARALAAFEAVPAEKRLEAANRLVNAFVLARRCNLAEPLLRAHPLASRGIAVMAHPEILDSDPACVSRLITLYAQTLVPDETEHDPWRLYTAGALWRRIGEHDKAYDAVDEAERRLAGQEASNPGDEWSCHGGNCISRLWSTRLWAVSLTRGTPHHRAELRWAATLALSQAYARDSRRPGPFIGFAVFEELLRQAVDAGDDRLAQLLAEQAGRDHASAYAGQRMRLLLERGKVAEALQLWPTAGAAFQAPISPVVFRENLPLFHDRRELLRTRLWHGSGDLLSLLAMVWIERGETERAREALATARAHHSAVKGYDWDPQHVQRLAAVEAMLEGGADPVGWLDRRNLKALGIWSERDRALRELAGLLAATGRQAETRRALAEIRDPDWRRRTLVELPCRAAYGGDSAATFAVRLASGHLHPGNDDQEKETGFANSAYQTFLCLVRAHRTDAAIAYAQGIKAPEVRLSLLTSLPLDSGIPGEPALRRRLARLAFSLVKSRNLWADEKVAYVAADFERAGDFAGAERVLARVRGAERRMAVFDLLLKVYGPGPY